MPLFFLHLAGKLFIWLKRKKKKKKASLNPSDQADTIKGDSSSKKPSKRDVYALDRAIDLTVGCRICLRCHKKITAHNSFSNGLDLILSFL
jgi:hypothetical protein